VVRQKDSAHDLTMMDTISLVMVVSM